MPLLTSNTYTGVAGRIADKYWFDRVQTGLTIKNNDTVNKITVYVADDEKTLAPQETFVFDEEFEYFHVKTKRGTASFTATASGSLTTQKAEYANQALKKASIVNLFDKESVYTSRKFNYLTAAIDNEATISASAYIKVKPNTTYVKSNTSSYLFFDADKNRIAGYASGSTFTTSSTTVYVVCNVYKTDLDSFMLHEGNTLSTQYVPFGVNVGSYFLDTNYAPEKTKRKLEKTTVNPLYIPTFEGSQNCAFHPSVLYIKNSIPGSLFQRRYWMVYTPYPLAGGTAAYLDRWECPCIMCSDDGVNWDIPGSLQNPIDDLTADEITNKDYFSDPHLVFNETTSKLECWYRITHVNGAALPTTILRKTSSDGYTWSAREIMIDLQAANNGVGTMVRSQSIIWDATASKYKMWYVDGLADEPIPGKNLCYSESSNGTTWSNKVVCSMDTYVDPWHQDTYYNPKDGTYSCLIYAYQGNISRLMYYISTDGINFTFVKEILRVSSQGHFYSKELYRSCTVYNDRDWMVYFSWTGDTYNPTRGIGLMMGKSMTELEVIDCNRARWTYAPTTPTGLGKPGQMGTDDNYLWVCKVKNTWLRFQRLVSGTAEARPTLASGGSIGFQYMDTTLAKPIWWDGTVWRDATAKAVWTPNKAYTVNLVVNTGANQYKCTVAGTSSSTMPTHVTGTATDGTVTWEFVKVVN